MKQKDIILILTLTSIIVISWIAFSVYHNLATSTISQVQSVDIKSINPTFDTKTIDKLKKRDRVSPIYELLPTPIPIKQATSGGNIKL
ncbi:MAG: hypothetical protein Q7R31_01610 [Candidatus Levybacteria bacterium]|nr:hypothetical protein [Candidatus Levybacteria bacterium]